MRKDTFDYFDKICQIMSPKGKRKEEKAGWLLNCNENLLPTQSASFLHFSICTENCKLDSRMLSAIELSVCTVHTRQISTTHYINILPKDSFILEGEDYS